MTESEHSQSRGKRGMRPVGVVLGVAGFLITIAGFAAAETARVYQAGAMVIDPAMESYTGQNGLSGKLSIAGSDTMRPLVSKLAAQFMSIHPTAQIGVEGTGSTGAIREFLLGLSYQRRGDKAIGRGTGGAASVELLASSRRLTDDELGGFESNYGYRPMEVPVALDAVAIYVNKDNPIPRLTIDEIDAIFSKTRKRGHAPIEIWGQAGVEGPLAKQPIHLYGRDKRSGTREFFRHVALKDSELHDSLVEQPGSASEILAIAQDPLAIGYAGTGFEIASVRTVPIIGEGGGAAQLPSQETVTAGTYPLGRSLYLYVRKDPKDKLDPLVKEFLSFVNSRQGQETVARANFYPLTVDQVAKNRQELGLTKGAMAISPAEGSSIRIAERLVE